MHETLIFQTQSEWRWNCVENVNKTTTDLQQSKNNMALANILLHLVIFLHIKLAIMQKPTAGNDNNPNEFNIGGVLSNSESEDHFRDTIAVSQIVNIGFFHFLIPYFT